MALKFDALARDVQTRNQEDLARASAGEYVRDPRPAPHLAVAPPEDAEALHVEPSPEPDESTHPAEEQAAALHVKRKRGTRQPRHTLPSEAGDALVAVVTARRDPATARPTEDLHFHIDHETGRRIRELEKTMRRRRLGDLNLSMLVETSLEVALQDPEGLREAALALPPIRGNARAIRVKVAADLREQLLDVADEYNDDDRHIPMARLARVAIGVTAGRLEHAVE